MPGAVLNSNPWRQSMITDSLRTENLELLQRTGLDPTVGAANVPTAAVTMDQRQLWRILGIGRAEKSAAVPRLDPQPRPTGEDLLIGMYGNQLPIAFLINGD